MVDDPTKEMVEWTKRTGFTDLFKQWILTVDSKFGDMIFLEMKQASRTGEMPLLLSTMFIMVKQKNEEGMPVKEAFEFVFHTLDEVYQVHESEGR